MTLIAICTSISAMQLEAIMAVSDRAAHVQRIIGSGHVSAIDLARRMAAAFLSREYDISIVLPDQGTIIEETEDSYTLTYHVVIRRHDERKFIVKVTKSGDKVECISGMAR